MSSPSIADPSFPVAMQFDDARQQRLAATLGMWAFLATEVLFFGGLFAGYAVYRYWHPAEWTFGSRNLDLVLGTVNTAVLLTSSLTMALAVRASQRDERQGLRRFLVATIVLGAAFLVIKAIEYQHKAHDGLIPGVMFDPHLELGEWLRVPALELFYAFYFVMTGLHALHMVIGIGVLAVIAAQSWWIAAQRLSTRVENSGLYWHFVDLVWVFLFPMLYLIDRT